MDGKEAVLHKMCLTTFIAFSVQATQSNNAAVVERPAHTERARWGEGDRGRERGIRREGRCRAGKREGRRRKEKNREKEKRERERERDAR